ncbi:methyltransferase domain-containing protein [Saccharopolyspora hattusasensis]|uniref:methyltransferase domain-containing protein n=1 Tax=Saccharopolyspora hattusasensis TaxID=1128679 RepID=UPI003D975E4A
MSTETTATPGTAWDAPFRAVDRAAFIPAQAWANDDSGRLRPIDRDTDPETWSSVVALDRPIVTQIDDGATLWPEVRGLVSSSASQPSVVRTMLEALDVQDGQRVLEVGTGTGYNAALLTERLGSGNVTTVDVDAALVADARASLTRVGYRPHVACADGLNGYPERAPYDRLICTASINVTGIPPAWLDQITPGGIILTPWGTDYHNGVLVRLTVHNEHSASGSVVGDAAFMRLRAQRYPFGHAARMGKIIEASTEVRESITPIAPTKVAFDDGSFAVGLRIPEVQKSIAYDEPDTFELMVYHVDSGSIAAVNVSPDATAHGAYPVREIGPRSLWSEVAAAHEWWTSLNRPGRTRFGLTVDGGKHRVWLDAPDNTITHL